MKRSSTFLFVLALAVVASLSPAGAEDDPGLTAMRALGFLEGRWEGEGWSRHGPGEPQRFRGTELVESRLDGRVLVVEGIHYGKPSGEVVHHAVATISFDPETERYRLLSHLASGRSGDFEADLVDGGFVWNLEIPNRGRVRYTIHVENDTWHEVGEFSADGEQWSQTFQMDLKKAPLETPGSGSKR